MSERRLGLPPRSTKSPRASPRNTGVDKDKIILGLKKELQALRESASKSDSSRPKTGGSDIAQLRVQLHKEQSQNNKLQQTISDLRGTLSKSGRLDDEKDDDKAKRKHRKHRSKSRGRSGARTARERETKSRSRGDKPRPKTPRNVARSKAPLSTSTPSGRQTPRRRKTSVATSVSDSKGGDSRLVEALQMVDRLNKQLATAEKQRSAAQKENQTLKAELVTLASQLKESMSSSNRDMMSQIEQLQQSVLEYQRKYDELKKKKKESVFDQSNAELKAQVEDLQSCLVQLQKENERMRETKAPNLDEYHSQIADLQKSVRTWQDKCDFLRKQNQRLTNQHKLRSEKLQTQRLSEKVSNLTFQMFYGQSIKDREVEELKNRVTTAENEAATVNRLRRKWAKMRDKQIEEWLFSDVANEAL